MICLIRHGETDWNLQGRIQGGTDIELNENGVKQAEACKTYFEGADWDLIIASPMKRAKRTAEIINKALNVDLVEMSDFKERTFGEAEGLTLAERNKLFPDGNYPGQESKEDLESRVMAGIGLINKTFPNKKVLLVAHGAVIHAILSVTSGEEIDFTNTKLLNACLSNIEYTEDKWHVHNYNQIDHLTVDK
ncbi:histidine phosphatase family protein [Paraliobacillus zengyii]|uniref:histidine phosphatase family protein n=1 Tax=Paraliobacillus zengyii TaxID=2213194 RepID=UPI000DD41669|nr:histidine phosphatase family protein [Paraliobacillus zengyii]